MSTILNESSSLWHTLRCPCHPDFTYLSARTFGIHFDSQRHQMFELSRVHKESRVRIGQLENEIRPCPDPSEA